MPARKHIPVPITEPIDFPALAAAFRGAKWKWGSAQSYDGVFPDPERIAEALAELRELLGSHLRSTYVESGGVTIERIEDKIVVSIDPRLAAHYKPNAENQQTKGNNYGKIQ